MEDGQEDHSQDRELVETGSNNSVEVLRCKGGGLSVSIRRDGLSTYRYASAANLARILLRIGTEDDLCLMTSFNALNTPRENHNNFDSIPNHVRSLVQSKEIEAYWLVGHWTDDSVLCRQAPPVAPDVGTSMDRLEYSWLLVNRNRNVHQSDWLLAATLLASEYEQHAFLIRLNGETTLRSMDGGVWETIDSDESTVSTWATLARLRARAESYGYVEVLKARDNHPGTHPTGDGKSSSDRPATRVTSELSSYAVAGDGFPHAIEFFLGVTGNISSKMRFASLGVSERLPNDGDSRSPWNFLTPAEIYSRKWIRGRS